MREVDSASDWDNYRKKMKYIKLISWRISASKDWSISLLTVPYKIIYTVHFMIKQVEKSKFTLSSMSRAYQAESI